MQSYLTCIRDWVHGEISAEGLVAEWTERVIHNLTLQWAVARRFAVNVISGEIETVHRFWFVFFFKDCFYAIELFSLINSKLNFLKWLMNASNE